MKRITQEDIRVATFDALPDDYRNHIDYQYENDYRYIQEGDFLDAILSYELIDLAMRTKRSQTKKPKDLGPKKVHSMKRRDHYSNPVRKKSIQ